MQCLGYTVCMKPIADKQYTDEDLTFETRLTEVDGAHDKAQCTWQYDKLYKTENGYKAHMLLTDKDLCYLTVACDDIMFEKNVHIKN